MIDHFFLCFLFSIFLHFLHFENPFYIFTLHSTFIKKIIDSTFFFFLCYELIPNLYDCSLHSFDPFIEDPFFANVRNKDSNLKNSAVLKVEDKWMFYRVGIAAKSNVAKNLSDLKISDLTSFDNLLVISSLKNKVIDVFKMDIEGPEKELINNMDMDYACKYFKSMLFETHKNSKFVDLVKLEQCFRLFYRSTRFFAGDSSGATGHMTEYQNPNGWNLNISHYGNELGLAEFLFTSGELYFVNINYIL